MKGKAHRAGLYQCNACREQFTLTVGNVFERSKFALNKWLLATFLLWSSKNGMLAHQLHRMLSVIYKTAWFMCHRIRVVMKEDVKPAGLVGGSGKIVEADDTYSERPTFSRPEPPKAVCSPSPTRLARPASALLSALLISVARPACSERKLENLAGFCADMF